MKLKKIRKEINRSRKITIKLFGKSWRFLFFKNQLSKHVRRYATMEAHKALKVFWRFLHTQISIRPRIRLFAKVTLVLILALFATSLAASYVKAKEAEIKVAGQPILVAKSDSQNDTNQTQIEAGVTAKRSPFDFKMPVSDGLVTQGFSSYHRAIDIAAPYDSPIKPLGEGEVEFAGFMPDGHGNAVIINHGDGLKTLYAHMSKVEVSAGQEVSADSEIGLIGLTGHTTGPHVHVEVYDNGVAINPSSVLPDN